MAMMHFRIAHHTARSGGTTAGLTLQYLTRVGEYAPHHEETVSTPGDTVKYGDYVTQTEGTLPRWAQGNIATVFHEAEVFERGGPKLGGRWATSWQLTLPRELSREEQWTMGTAFVAQHLRGHAYLAVMHDPIKNGQSGAHLHVLFSERVDHGQTRDAATYFRRPEVGGAAKDPWFTQRGSAWALRASWSDWINYTMERAGHAERVHPRSLYARDIGRKPEPKVGWSTDPAKHAAREVIRAQRDEAKEQRLAHAGWEARKERLGIENVRDIEPERFLEMTYVQARGQERGTWDPEWAREKAARLRAGREREEARLMHEHRQLTRDLVRHERHHADLTRTLSPREVTRVLANGRTLGLEPVLLRTPQIERGHGRAARGRVFEDERHHTREEGYGYDR